MVTIFDSVGATLLSLDLSNLNYLEYILEEDILDVQFSGDASYPCPVFRGFFVPTTSALGPCWVTSGHSAAPLGTSAAGGKADEILMKAAIGP